MALAALAAVTLLSACTTLHEDRRTLTEWNWKVVTDHAQPITAPEGMKDWDGTIHPIIDWITVEPVAFALLPVSWLGDTLILNPIDGWKKAELAQHKSFESRYSEGSTAQTANQNFQTLPPAMPPWIVADALTWPHFALNWVWNSTYPTDPHCETSWNKYWQQHNEVSSQ
jgi:hypothetical protein